VRQLVFKNHFKYNLVARMIRWHLSYYLCGKGTPVSAGVYITDACNCRCIMCDVWKNEKPSVYPRDAQERAIDALSRMGCYYYSISGGEPTIVKDLPDRLSYASRKIPYVHLVTNGLSMTPELARAIGSSGVKEISISIDGSEKFHNYMRGMSSAFDRAWKALDLILTYAPKVHVVVNSVLSPYNIDGLRELDKCLSSLAHVQQKYLPLTFHELFLTKERKSLFFPWEAALPHEVGGFIDDAIANSNIVNSDIFLRKAKRFFNGEQDVIPEQKSCLYPFHSIEFDSRGLAYPCITGMGFKDGIPPNVDLKTYLQSDKYSCHQKELKACDKCRGSMMLCYYEPRLNFPVHNLIRGYLQGSPLDQ